jgi:glycerol-3-phosphate acyltransferase PlsY
VVGTGLAAILGHIFPIYLRFRGGKAVATSTGVFLVLAPWAALIAAAAWGIVFALWRYVSLASISAAVALPAAVWFLHPDPLGSGRYVMGLSAVGAALVVLLHYANIARLLAGTEQKVGGGPKSGP